MSESERSITVGDYLLYRRCPRSLHLRLTGRPMPSWFEGDRLYPVVAERDRVREIARRRFPHGVDAQQSADPSAALFGARCYYEPYEAVADVWRPTKPEGMAAVLVREGTSVKESYLHEAAFLDYCFAGCDARPQRIVLLHVDKSYRRAGDVDPYALFVERDLTRRVRRMADAVDGELEELRTELDADPTLERYRDTLCTRPTSCPVCSRDLPTVGVDHVTNLHRGGPLVGQLIEDGITSIEDIPIARLAHRRQEIQRETIIGRRAHVDATALGAFLSRLAYPVCYLDFEATSTAVPPFDAVRPWEHVPYLYSLHTELADGAVTHRSFMMEPGVDERRELVDRLLADAGGCGSLVVYSAGFERGILARLAEAVPERADAIGELSHRIVDLLEPFREFAYHHHEQRGKVSLKKVLPVLTEQDYSGESVRDGYTANLAYRHLAETTDSVASQRERTRRERLLEDLSSYCAMDTVAMLHIVRELRRLAGEGGDT